MYKRPDNRRYVQKGGTRLDNSWVIPYNMYLLKKYHAHINVEWCNKGVFVKYLFKYVTKGPDCGKVYIKRARSGEEVPYDEKTDTVNEVKEYLDCRYIYVSKMHVGAYLDLTYIGTFPQLKGCLCTCQEKITFLLKKMMT
jgi:hypothetical protein